MTQYDKGVLGGTVVNSHGSARLNIGIKNGKIAYLGTEIPEAEVAIDAGGLMVMPGGVDAHVHFMDPGATDRETFELGSRSAAKAGVTSVVEHTHAWPIRSAADLSEKRSLIHGSHVDFGLGAHAWPGHANEVAALWAGGISFFKVFTCTTHGIPGHDAAMLRKHLIATSDVGALSLIHCEDESLCDDAEKDLNKVGRTDFGIIPEWRNADAELIATQAAALLARKYSARVNIAHVSGPEIAAHVNHQRHLGGDLWIESCPQYFLLRENEVLDEGALRKFTPPARTRTAREEERMWQLLREGVINYISSDHAPSTMPQKHAGDIWEVPFGLPGLDTTFPALLNAAYYGELSWQDIARVYAENPARRYGFWGRKGALRIGFDADIALIDPDDVWTLTADEIESKAKWSPYCGRTFHGRNVQTLLRGETIYTANSGVTDGLGGKFLPGVGQHD